MLEPIYRRVAAEVPIEKGRVLDVGCGAGRLARLLAAGRPEVQVVGLDASPDMIEQARRGGPLPNLVLREGAIESAGFQAEFDFAITVLSFHHWEEPRPGLEAVHRALAPGGRFWIYEPNPQASNEEIRSDHAPMLGWLRVPCWLERRISRSHGFSLAEVERVVQPLLATTPFGGCQVSKRGSTLRLELARTGSSPTLG